MPYEQFEIKLAGDETSGYYAEVLHAPSLQRTNHRQLDLPAAEIRAWKQALADDRATARDTLRVGTRLFAALFSGDILRLWESSRGSIHNGGGLRVRLDIRSPALAAVPWEIMHDGHVYLAQTITTPIVRCLSNHRRPRYRDGSSTPNVLLVTATPRNATALPNVDAEAAAILHNLYRLRKRREIGYCDLLSHATRESLQAKLREADYDIVHYVGHGVFDGSRGYLVLEDETGRADLIDSATLGVFLTDTSVRLLFLNCCETAVPSVVESTQGVAEATLVIGVPAVVAMSTVVRDDVAAEFARVFYEVLVQRRSLEFCMTEARKGITRYHAPYWAIPVLFTNLVDESTRKNPKQRKHIVIKQEGETNIVAENVYRS